MSDSHAPRRRKRPDPQPRRQIRWSALVLPGLGLVAVIALVWIIVAATRMLSPAGASVAVPTFVGLRYADAEGVAKKTHLSLHVVARKPDYHAPKDEIVGQLPAAGEHVREGRVIDLVLSDGEPTAKVPNVANMSVRDATVALENAHLDVGSVSSQYDSIVPEATVLSQQPDALSQVPAGTKVDLVIAKGQPVAYAPNFVGMPIASAPAAAKEANVKLAPSVQMPIAPSAPPKGIIVAQDPPAGQQMHPNETITLQVSGGALPTPVPSPTFPSPGANGFGQSPAAGGSPQAPSPASSPAARGLRVSVALPESPQPVRIRVVVVDATGSRTLFDQNSKGGTTISFDITVTGAATLETYIGDQLVNSTPL
ncbi:MAG TPA: PASTA domain-containing protein [Candidatus Eremiobacteraceae bacterium]|nr:PASTA domain-containing protein [Candidatus Eremiobacteraceae bacterium]